MYKLFNFLSPTEYGIVKFNKWLYAHDGLRRNLSTILRYYRRNPTAVNSAHFLVQLLQNITVPQSQVLQRYYDNVDAMALNMSMALKMTSSIYKGSVFNGVFYGKGNTEILIAHNEGFDFIAADRDWQNLIPVKVLRHPMSDLDLPILDGGQYGIEEGIAVIAINIPMLAVQYRAFRNNEIQATQGTSDTQRSLMQFVRMYVLPNMLQSHLDVALINRLTRQLHDEPYGKSKFKHSFYITDYSKAVDDVQGEIISSLQNVSRDFSGIMRTIPLVSAPTMQQAMVLPDIAPTRQVVWALSISRLNAISLLFDLSKLGPGVRNQAEVNVIARSALAYKNDGIIREALPLEEYLEIQDEIDNIVHHQ